MNHDDLAIDTIIAKHGLKPRDVHKELYQFRE